MINESTLNSVQSAAAILAAKNFSAVAKPDTVLANLVALSVPPINSENDATESLDTFKMRIAGTTIDNGMDASQHSVTLNAFTEDLGKLVTTHISYAKNTVKPIVMQMAESILHYKETNVAKDATSSFNIEILNVPALLNDDSFLGTIEPYKDKTVIEPDLLLELAGKNKEEIIQLMMLGHDRTNQLVLEWISSVEAYDPNFLETVWFSFFTKANPPSGNYLKFSSLGSVNVYKRADIALALYLLGNKLFNEVQSDIEINLSVYKNITAQIRDFGGAMLANCIIKLALNNKTKILVVESFPRQFKVSVNGDVYREWLAAGGKPEVILGLIVSNETQCSVPAIDEKAASFESSWNSYCNFHKAREANMAIDYFKVFLNNTFSSMYREQDQSEVDFITANPHYVANVKKLVDEQIECYKTNAIDDPYQVALDLIAKCRFGFTAAYSILSDINEAGKVNPNIDVREAALLATINYIADYLADQITLTA